MPSATDGHDGVDVRMEAQVTRPGVQHHRDAGACSEDLEVFGPHGSRGEGFASCATGRMTMTATKDLKSIIRDRMAKTGEAYTTARRHVLLEQARRGLKPLPPTTPTADIGSPSSACQLELRATGRPAE
jgi:hypothetical protein